MLVLTCLLAPAAYADDSADEQARILYENGAMLYDEGRYEDAIAAWQEAYRLSQRSVLLFNIANAEERVGRYREALDHLNRYRAFAPPEERETLDRRIANLERRLNESSSTTTTTTTPTTSTPPPAAEPASKTRVLPIVLFGVGGAGLATGGVFGALALSARADAEAACVSSAAGYICSSAASDAIAADKTRSLVADIGFGVGALGLIGGVVTLVIPDRPATAMNLGVSTDGSRVYVSGRF